jgi:Flp pilus assembly protein TadB
VDDDPVLRSLAADLEHDDPGLAAFLSTPHPLARTSVPHRHHPVAWALLGALPLLVLAVILPVTVTVGVVAMVLVIAAPLAVCWLCAMADDPPRPRNP